MQDGGKVIYLRHAATNPNEVDTGRLADRAGQRNLSPAGIEQAKEIGRAFSSLHIPVNEVLASPVFRARDTAELAVRRGPCDGNHGHRGGRVRRYHSSGKCSTPSRGYFAREPAQA